MDWLAQRFGLHQLLVAGWVLAITLVPSALEEAAARADEPPPVRPSAAPT